MDSLTPDNYRSVAYGMLLSSHIFEEEFESVLRIPSLVNKGISKIKNDNAGGNIKIMVNDTITFFNHFGRKNDAVSLYLYLVGENNSAQAKSILHYIGIWDGVQDVRFRMIVGEEMDSYE